MLGYNFNFKTPFDSLRCMFDANSKELKDKLRAKLNSKSSKIDKQANDELERIRFELYTRFSLQIFQVAIDSTILPLALYFEPEEIAAACVAIGSFIFRQSYPVFSSNCQSSQLRYINKNNTAIVASGGGGAQAPLQISGQELTTKYFKEFDLPNLDIYKCYLEITDQEIILKETPVWFN